MVVVCVVQGGLARELPTVSLLGAGASFPSQVYFSWIPAFRNHRAAHAILDMRYDAVGSSAGKRRIKEEEGPPVDYAGSDSLLDDQDYVDHPDLRMFPTLAG